MWEFTSGVSPFHDKAHDFQLSLSICKGERPEIMENTPQCYIDLIKKCWNEDPLKRPSALEVKNIIGNWIFLPNGTKIEDINEELLRIIVEFRKAPFMNGNFTKTHPQAYYTSRLFDFTSEKLNESLKSNCSYYRVNEISKISGKLNKIPESECLDSIVNVTSEIESQDSQAYYASNFTSGKVYEMSRSEDLNDCIVEDMNH
ncbi:unnamed protein product [Rhizophagus irregularis]|nr:unnamed protein product [Rhizophagus irregularis]